MRCPHCGGETGGAQICPYCDSRLDNVQPKRVKLDFSPGVYTGAMGSCLRITEEYLHIHRGDWLNTDRWIPIDQLTGVYVYSPKWNLVGYLILRWTENYNLPIPVQKKALNEPTAMPFFTSQKDIFYSIYDALFTLIQKQREERYQN